MIISLNNLSKKHHQQGVAIVEFTIIFTLLLIILFGIFEFGRLFYVLNSVQEVTRRAAREAVVRWTPANELQVKQIALFGADDLPAGTMINTDSIEFEYLNQSMGTSSPLPDTPLDNIEECLVASARCIAFVRVHIDGVKYTPLIGLFSGIELKFPFKDGGSFLVDLRVPIPPSTVTMPAESMGYSS